MPQLSILIPSRNEQFLNRTIQDIVKNRQGDTEVIVVIDGQEAGEPIKPEKGVTVIRLRKSIGQRAATNMACRLSKAKYVAKVDAHCAFDKGFDVKLMEEMQDDWTMVPIMRNLHAFDWVCAEGHRRYQGPSGPCHECGKETWKDIVWIAKRSPQSTSFCFDSEPHFQYFGEWKAKQEGDIVETMSLQGSFFMLTRERYWALKISDEETFGSWGSQGIEVACKTWLSGGRVVCNRKTWYAHMFRTQGGDFGFPYKQDGSKVQAAKKKAREVFFDNKFELQTRPLSWLLEKFWPVPGWTDKQLKELQAWPLQNQKKPDGITKGAAYYTDNKLPKEIAVPVFKNLEKVFPGKIKAVSLAPLSYTKSTVLDKERGYLTMFEQILTALRGLDTDIVFMTEHDVLYHPSHFDFVPIKGTFHYNTNVWKVRIEDGHALWVDNCRQVSGLCAWREDLIAHYEERVSYVREKGYSNKMGFEPGTHSRITWKRQFKCDTWMSAFPNVDIRHQANLTPNRWSPDLFRDKRNCEGWKEAEEVPGWGKITISTLNGNLR